MLRNSHDIRYQAPPPLPFLVYVEKIGEPGDKATHRVHGNICVLYEEIQPL